MAVGSALLLTACAGTTGDTPSPRAEASASPSPSPSRSCPERDEVLAAVREPAEDDSGSGYELTRRGVLACERGYATVEVRYPGSDSAIVVLRLTGDRWKTVIMGTDVCSGEGADGRKRPRWMEGVPDSVVTAARCQPDFYRD